MSTRARAEVEAELAKVRWLLYVWWTPGVHQPIDVLCQHREHMLRLEARLLAELAATRSRENATLGA